ncbi:MAG: ANTAR domain-containing protein [Streptosporangiaceae bacterium]
MTLTDAEARARAAVLRQQAAAESRLAAAGEGDTAVHRMAAAIAERRAGDIEAWLAGADRSGRRPRMVHASAVMLGTPSVSAMMRFGDGGRWSRLSASDEAGQAAAEAEMVTGQGPATEAWQSGLAIYVPAPEVAARWPLYAHAGAAPANRSVAAAPLGPAEAHLGAICAYYDGAADLTLISTVAAALTRLMLHQAGNIGALLARDTDLAIVHQATGYLAARTGCSPAEAHNLLEAFAVADNVPLAQAAAAVLRGGSATDARFRLGAE